MAVRNKSSSSWGAVYPEKARVGEHGAHIRIFDIDTILNILLEFVFFSDNFPPS